MALHFFTKQPNHLHGTVLLIVSKTRISPAAPPESRSVSSFPQEVVGHDTQSRLQFFPNIF
jgi:hypothetical protein